jgi:hypothetical protein
VGFNSGKYGGLTVPTSTGFSDELSNITPELTPVNSVLVCNTLIKNPYGEPSTLMTSFSATVSYGALIDVEFANLAWLDITPGSYNEFTVTFLDQSFRQMKLLDSNNVILLLIDIQD